MMSMRRLPIAALLASTALALAACGGDDASSASGGEGSSAATAGSTKIRFLQPIPKTVYFYPLFVAEELGYFEDEGVEVELKSGSQDIPLPAFVSNGDADIGAAGGSQVLQALTKGADFDVFFDYYTKSAEGMVVAADSPIQSMSDMAGKTLGLGSQEDTAIAKAALTLAGIDPKSVKQPIVGTSGPTVAKAIKDGKIDAYSGALSDFAALQAAGIELREITPQELTTRPAASFIARPEFLEKHRAATEGFLKAWAKATYVGMVNKDVVEAMARKAVPEEWTKEKVGKAALDVAVDYQTPTGDQFGELLPDAWQSDMKVLLDAGELEKDVDITSRLNDAFIAAANDWDHSEVEADVERWASENLGG